MIAFYHGKDGDMLMLGWDYQTWLTNAYTILPLQNFFPSQREIKTYWKEFEKTSLVVHLSILHAKHLLMKLLSKSLQTCLSTIGIDASQLYPYSMCQHQPIGLYTQWDIVSETSRFTPPQKKTRSFENVVMSFFQRTRPDYKIGSFYTTSRQKQIDRFSVDGFSSHCNTVFEAMVCFYHFCPYQELRPSFAELDIKHGSRKRELDELRRGFIHEKGFTVTELWEREWWRLHKTTTNVKQKTRENFLYRQSLTEQQLPEGIKKGNLLGYVQFDIEVPENLRANFSNFPPIFKNT